MVFVFEQLLVARGLRVIVLCALAIAGASAFATRALAADCDDQWTGWVAVPGGGTADAAPTVASNGQRLFLFTTHRQRIITNELHLASESWSGWTEVPGNLTTNRPVAATWADSRLYLFARGTDRSLYVNVTSGSNLGWSGWQKIAASSFSAIEPTAVSSDGIPYVFQTGDDRKLYFSKLPIPTRPWTAWQRVPGVTTDRAIAATTRVHQIHLIGRGLTGRIFQLRSTHDPQRLGWSSWTFVPGDAISNDALGAAGDEKNLAIVRRGTTDLHQYVSRINLNDGSSSGWLSVGGGGVTDTTSALAYDGNRLMLFSRGVTDHQIYVNVLGPDRDCDTLADVLEQRLLARFRPYYRFSLDSGADTYHPADALWFIRNSNLLTSPVLADGVTLTTPVPLANDPGRILREYSSTAGWGYSDRTLTPAITGFQLDIPDDLREGERNFDVVQRNATGLYGHVMRLPDGALKVEYWQFFPFNDAPVDEFRHEGDWETVQLVVEADGMTIRHVIHEIHGKQIRFEIQGTTRVELGAGVQEYQGENIDVGFWGPAGIERIQNSRLRIYCVQGECTHPVVYIEHSGHAMWPSEHGGWVGSRKHNGDGAHYLVATPPNLGETGAPNPDCPGADLILNFNGRWGSYNEGPEGPAMKGSWGQP